MILVDANLLLYAYDSSAPEHPKARDWLEDVLAKPEPVLFPWQSIHAFLRIGTNPRAWKAPLTIEEARAIVDEWLSLPNVVTPSPGERHSGILRELLAGSECRRAVGGDAVLEAIVGGRHRDGAPAGSAAVRGGGLRGHPAQRLLRCAHRPPAGRRAQPQLLAGAGQLDGGTGIPLGAGGGTETGDMGPPSRIRSSR